ncbi:Lactosylceramide 4-alpha-galactosyltransferase [Trachymyrmex septentrionalis]|uniref:Nucleoside diphosphate-linked moiety X motif 6 n=1 Tax=Trachymyrmex septentrionalis TaxID=34720 RepID=A0A195FP29_9HYME|nr:PREDICTED: uncharacterized protein LOC108746137 [Trachymyrmex septentrionalis]KYN42320.1 Lactosylceramide 4-alpha-galactosyltransferase [Trachymyrmex septentrionalis]
MKKFKMKKRLLWCGFTFAVVLLILMISTESNIIQRIPFLDVTTVNGIKCYDKVSTTKSSLDFDWETNTDKPTSGRNIFFHETSCFGDEGLTLNARQACAIESAARMNPSMTVYLLFISKSEFSNSTREIVRQLLNYSNVRIRHIDPQKYVKETPLDAWYTSGVLKKSHWPVSHMSDILRYLTLWKYGGIYLDLDVVVTSSLENLTNFAGAEDWDDVAAGVMGFDMSKLGRRVADACVRDLKKNFRGDVWGNNGPGVITRTLQKLCATTYARDMTTNRCHGFTVYPPSIFYPIHYKKWKKYFEIKDSNVTLKALNKAKAIHVWNNLSKAEKVRVNSNVPYAVIARNYCPHVFNNCDEQMLIPSRCIFFHETMCSPPNLTPQQACAVESSARNNRNLNVFLLFFATKQFSEKSKRYVKILETYDNVYIRRIRLSTYIIDTPIEDWFWANIRKLWENHDWLHKIFHDYVRMLTLWKFGGVSLNLNSVVLTSLDKLTTFAGVQDNRDVDVGVFGVDTSTDFGRNFIDACMEIIKSTNANSYLRYNITRVITEAIWKLCYQRNDKECRQFTIYSPEKFYPSFSDSREVHTNKTRAKEMLKIEKNAMMIHLLNNYNRSTEANNVMAFKMAAEQNCPKIYDTRIGQLSTLDAVMAQQIFKGHQDHYNGITIDSVEEACDNKIFVQRLKDSLEQWIMDKRRTIWFRVHIPHTEWVPILTRHGFIFHHSKEEYVMLYRWLPTNEACNVPKYAHTYLGVGAFVFNKNTSEILVIKEKYAPTKASWKLPGGYVEPGEDIETAAKREVLEETGIQANFKCLVSFRHGHDYYFGCSDIYMIAYLIPQNFEIDRCKREISECKWMKLSDFMQHPEVHANNKTLAAKTIDFLEHQMGIVANYGIHPITKKQICVYSVQNTDIKNKFPE